MLNKYVSFFSIDNDNINRMVKGFKKCLGNKINRSDFTDELRKVKEMMSAMGRLSSLGIEMKELFVF